MSEEVRYYAKPGPTAPLALPNQLIGIWLRTEWQCYRIEHLEPIPRSHPFIKDLGNIALNSTSGKTEITELQQRLSPPEAFQLRFYPLDDIRVTLYIGSADTRFMTVKGTATVDLFTRLIDPDLHSTEVVILTNSNPFLDAANPGDYALVKSRVAFFGYRYSLAKDSLRSFHTAAEAIKALGPITLCQSGGF